MTAGTPSPSGTPIGRGAGVVNCKADEMRAAVALFSRAFDQLTSLRADGLEILSDPLLDIYSGLKKIGESGMHVPDHTPPASQRARRKDPLG